MNNLLNLDARDALVARLQKLRPDSQRQWGKLSASQILPHLADPFRVTLGEKKARSVANFVTKSFVGKLLVRRLPWPKGAPTSPDFLPGTGMTEPKSFEEDRQALLLLVHRFANLPENAALEPHPVFGPLSLRDHGRLYWRHIDYHLRQFGV